MLEFKISFSPIFISMTINTSLVVVSSILINKGVDMVLRGNIIVNVKNDKPDVYKYDDRLIINMKILNRHRYYYWK